MRVAEHVVIGREWCQGVWDGVEYKGDIAGLWLLDGKGCEVMGMWYNNEIGDLQDYSCGEGVM